MTSVAVSILTGIVIATVSAWVTVQLSLGRFRAEKWWERRVEAYERVIGALHDTKSFADTYIDASHEGTVLPKERDEELRARSNEGHFEIERAADVGGFLLGNEARDRLRRYQQEAKAATMKTNWYEYLENDWTATSSCLEDIISIAKKDLKAK